MPAPDNATLCSYIGFLPGTNKDSDVERLAAQINSRTFIRALVKDFLNSRGLPVSALSASSSSSLAKAYVKPAYLAGWLRKLNSSFSSSAISATDLGLLDDTKEDAAEADASARADANAAQTPPPGQSAEWLKSLFTQIDATVGRLVEAKLATAKLTVTEEVKEQIHKLARDAASARAEELAPPRRIEVTNAEAKTTVALGLQHERFPLLLRATQARDHRGFKLNIWLTGPTGSGKTSAAEAVAKALSLPFGSDGSLDADYKVLGFRDANGNIISTQFLEIYEKGGIYVADEIDNWLPSALLSLNAALANGWVSTPKGMIPRHPDACIIACANTWGLGATSDYVGRTKLDAASLDRFQPKIDWPIDEKLERAVADNQSGEYGYVWHNLVKNVRHQAKLQGLKIIISPRATFSGIALLHAGFSLAEVADMAFAAGLSTEQKTALKLPQAIEIAAAAHRGLLALDANAA